MKKEEFLKQLDDVIGSDDLDKEDFVDILWAALHNYTGLDDDDDLLTYLEDTYSDFPFSEFFDDEEDEEDDEEDDEEEEWDEDEQDVFLEALKEEIERNPHNWEARLNYILSVNENHEDMIIELQKLIEEMEMLLRRRKMLLEDGALSDAEDEEVISYLRVRTNYFYTLITTGMLKMALKEGESLMQLDEDDIFGIRFNLLHLYVYFEEYEKAQEMYDHYEDGNMMEMPMALMYFKQCRFDQSYEVIDRIYRNCPAFPRYLLDNCYGSSDFSYLLDKDDIDENSYDELEFMTMTNIFLYAGNRFFMRWALNELDNNYDIEDDLAIDNPFDDDIDLPF